MKNEKFLCIEKLDCDLLEELLRDYKGVKDERIIVGPGIGGEDAAVIDFGDK